MLTTPLRLRPTVCFCLLALPVLARAQSAPTAPSALPTGASVASGAVTLRQDASTLRVNQTSDKAIVNWNTFNIGRDAAVQFVQPGASSTILNRVANGPSDIAGQLTSNGRVYLLNPNGVLFSPTARVDVGSLVAAAGAVSDSSFLAGAVQIATSGAVSNAGTLNAADGGSVVLAGASVGNSGSIVAPHGAITLAAGDAIRVNLSDDGLIQAQVTLAAPQALIANSGLLHSEGGSIALVASSSAGAPGGLVINSGIVRAGAVHHHGGTVSLIGGEVQAGGSIDASSTEGDAGSVRIFGDLQAGSVHLDARIDAQGAGGGGMVETSAAHVQAGSNARVSTLSSTGRHGTWLIDPQDYTIGAAAGDDISGATLSANLELGNVTIQSVAGARSGSGDVKVNAPISWGASTTLTLSAANSILFASGAAKDARNPNGAALANLRATGDSAGLVMNFANGYFPGENKLTLSGATPGVTINGLPFTVMNAHSTPILDAILRSNLAGNFVLTEDIDASGTARANNGQGWLPLGTTATPFSGQLHGFGHVISDLTINRPGTSNVGLIAFLTGTVRDLGLVDPHITGSGNTGALVGTLRYVTENKTRIVHSHVAGGSVSGTSAVGGLVGFVSTVSTDAPLPVIDASYTSNVQVTGSADASPLAGAFTPWLIARMSNSFYNADDEVNSTRPLGPGALFGVQFAGWLAGNRSLRIADYAASLPLDANSGSYQLSTLQGMRDLLGFANAGLKIRLSNDLDLANAPGLYLPVFSGEFDGANHTISNLTLNVPDSLAYAGLVGFNTGTIKNLNVANARISGRTVGGIAGGNIGTIQNTSVSGALSGNDSVGGLVGAQTLATSLLADSVSTATIKGSSSYGGVIGDLDAGTLRNSHYNADTVLVNGATSSLSMGGLRSAQYTDWISHARTLDIANYSALLPRDSASGAYLVSSVAGVNALLGFVDRPDLTFRLSANIDLAPAPGLFLPYLMGTLDGNGHQISNLKVNEPNQQYLGLVGVNYGTVRNLGASNVALNGFYAVGGLVGRNHLGATIENSFTSGTVTSGSGSDGGLVGDNRGTIANTYSSASVLGTAASSGGLIGSNAGTISTSLATGAVSSSSGGGLVGNGSGTVTNSFWNTDTTGRSTSKGGTGKTAAELQSVATYTGWDFAATWRMVGGTASLRPFTAGQFDLVIDANDLTVVYGAGAVTPASLSVTTTGLQGADSMALLNGTLAYSGNGIGALNAGSYSVLPGGLTSAKYDIIYTPGVLTVARSPLVLTADDKSTTLGTPAPVLTYSASGLRYADSAAMISGVSLSTDAATPGAHPIVISGGGAGPNYSVSYVNGTLNVAAPAQTPVVTQSLVPAAQAVTAPRVPEAGAAGAVAVAASMAAGVTPQRELLFARGSDAITRDPGIGTLKLCDDDNLGDCIARPRTAFQAEVAEDMGGAAPAMHIKRKLALVIGNHAYHSPLSKLVGAGNDAAAVAALLRAQGYQVDQLANANRSAMIGALNRLILSSEPADSVLVFYAGHGYIHPGSSVGYWIPTDANVDDPRGWISNIDIARFLGNIPARQQLLVSDSCFSGALTREGEADKQQAAISRNAILMRRSVVAMSSGGEEVVLDSALDGHSPFTYHLLRQLKANQGEIPARAMLLAIRDKVSKDAGQVPAYGIIISSGHASGGEYLLNPDTN